MEGEILLVEYWSVGKYPGYKLEEEEKTDDILKPTGKNYVHVTNGRLVSALN